MESEVSVAAGVVVVVEELSAPGAGGVEGVEVAGPCRAVLQRLEVGFDAGVVVGGVGVGVGAGHADVFKELGDGLGCHRAAVELRTYPLEDVARALSDQVERRVTGETVVVPERSAGSGQVGPDRAPTTECRRGRDLAPTSGLSATNSENTTLAV